MNPTKASRSYVESTIFMNGGLKMMFLVWLLTWWILRVMKLRPSFTWTTRLKIVKSAPQWSKSEKFTVSKTDNAKGITLKKKVLNLFSTWRLKHYGASKLLVEVKTKSFLQKSELSPCLNIKSSQFQNSSKPLTRAKIVKQMFMGSWKTSKSVNTKAKSRIQ